MKTIQTDITLSTEMLELIKKQKELSTQQLEVAEKSFIDWCQEHPE
jgi:predicted transcriptional regulator